ncbi:cell division protein FtsQ/DivIB [Massilia cavernae]|uniref:Cell division protein FtsQ n=1 Tax=Massilia cavernae TaxID=2320864 RepID=A0A418XA93_9BURK|nr:cell division protein FtsQ/DivIB [Massilia cavernae]RJG09422.1 FtsQ-type POTRA domain-containing protein [Massilia cavernae]
MWQDVRALNATANSLMALVVIALLASGVWWISQRPMFDLRTVYVEHMYGMELKHVNRLTLAQGVLGKVKGNFFTTDLEQVRTAFESVPWVRRATVRREWPDQLIVEVEEHEALGTWGEDGRLLSVKGDIFTANLAEADEDHELPAFDGPKGSEKEVLARFIDLRNWFAPASLVPTALNLSGRYAWTAQFSNGMEVALGREQDAATLKNRVARLVGIYPQLSSLLKDGIATVDMRYQNGLALSAHGLQVPSDISKPVKAVSQKTKSTSSTNRNRQ